MDNAALHLADDVSVYVDTLMRVSGVRIVYSPTFSPELNPCELCFGIIKKNIKEARFEGNLFAKMLEGICKIDFDLLVQFYKHCLFPKVILPEIN